MAQTQESRILYVVDDDDSVRKALSRLMRVRGFDVREYASPQRFLDALTPDGDACILLDITMPELTGLQVQEQLRARGIDWPVIAVSAREDDEIRQSSRTLGAQFFLRKPVDAQALLDAIAWVTASCKRASSPPA